MKHLERGKKTENLRTLENVKPDPNTYIYTITLPNHVRRKKKKKEGEKEKKGVQ